MNELYLKGGLTEGGLTGIWARGKAEMKQRIRIMALLLMTVFVFGGCQKENQTSEGADLGASLASSGLASSSLTSSKVSEGHINGGPSLSSNETAKYNDIVDELIRQYGKLRIVTWLSEAEDPDGITKEADGVCYLRLLDFDNDGDLELYAVCKNEEDDEYTGRVYSADQGMEPIFEEPVNSVLAYWNQYIELACKDRTQYYVFVRKYSDGRGRKDTHQLYGYNPDYPDHFSYTRFSSMEESELSDGTWHMEYMIRDDAVNGEWIIYDETEYNKEEEKWWADAEIETSLCVRSSTGEVDQKELTAALEETARQLDFDIDQEDTESSPEEANPITDVESMDSIAGAVIFHCAMEDLSSWKPSAGNAEDFWNIMCYYANAESGILEMDPPRTGDYGEFMILPNSVLVNAGYSCFSDFNGVLPESDHSSDRVRTVDQNNTGVAVGDSIHMDRISYTTNEDKSIDAVYSFYDGEKTVDYTVHMILNPNYNKANDFFTYYYTIDRVETSAEQAESTTQYAADQHPPFYGIWCGAAKDEAGAKSIASALEEHGLPAEVFITTEWSNLNTERWYVISAGTYKTQEEAEQALPRVKEYYNDAYIKYSGEWIAK